MRKDRAFTLIEVLIVLTLIGLTFSLLLLVFSRGIDSSLNLSEGSEALKRESSLFWELQRKILGAKRIKVDRESIYMITTGGSFNRGVVKCAYLFRDGKLYYYEFPYPYGAIDEIEEEKLYEVGKFRSFRVSVREGDRDYEVYDGMPQLVKVEVNGEEFVFETIR